MWLRTHLQISWGHHPKNGWEVKVIGEEPFKCSSRDEAERLYESLKGAYRKGQNDLRGQFAKLLTHEGD